MVRENKIVVPEILNLSSCSSFDEESFPLNQSKPMAIKAQINGTSGITWRGLCTMFWKKNAHSKYITNETPRYIASLPFSVCCSFLIHLIETIVPKMHIGANRTEIIAFSFPLPGHQPPIPSAQRLCTTLTIL